MKNLLVVGCSVSPEPACPVVSDHASEDARQPRSEDRPHRLESEVADAHDVREAERTESVENRQGISPEEKQRNVVLELRRGLSDQEWHFGAHRGEVWLLRLWNSGSVDILEAMAAGNVYHADSLDAPGREGLPSPLEALGAKDDNLVVRLNRVGLTQAMEILNDRERHVLRRYVFDGRTQADIGKELCCSQMQVSRLIAMVLARLRCRLVD